MDKKKFVDKFNTSSYYWIESSYYWIEMSLGRFS